MNADRSFVREIAIQITAILVVAVFGGAAGVWVGYLLLKQRVDSHEERIVKLEASNQTLLENLSQIRSDVSYLRGRLEPRP